MPARRLTSAATVGIVLLAACSSSRPAEPASPAPQTVASPGPEAPVVPPPAASVAAPPASEAPAPSAAPATPPTQAAAQPKQPVLGAPCTPAAAAPGTLDACGTKGKVSLVFDSHAVFLVRDATCKPSTMHMQGVYQPSACVSGDELWAASACIACRMMGAGWSAHAKISDLTKEQALDLQKRLGLDTARAFARADEWQHAIEGAREKQSP